MRLPPSLRGPDISRKIPGRVLIQNLGAAGDLFFFVCVDPLQTVSKRYLLTSSDDIRTPQKKTFTFYISFGTNPFNVKHLINEGIGSRGIRYMFRSHAFAFIRCIVATDCKTKTTLAFAD